MKLPITVIIPTFNEERYLPKLLRSLKRQSMEPREIIVADAFSTDKTRTIARTFGCKVINGGLPAQARNQGAKMATQDLLLFLDADVVLPPRFLERTVTEMMNRELDITSCFLKPMSRLKIDSFLQGFANYYIRFTKDIHPHIPGCCIFVRKQLHKKIRGFNETLKLAEDHDYVGRAKKWGKFGYLKSYKVPISVRRLSQEGRLKIAVKYLFIELHLIFVGQIKKDLFSYNFGNFKHR